MKTLAQIETGLRQSINNHHNSYCEAVTKLSEERDKNVLALQGLIPLLPRISEALARQKLELVGISPGSITAAAKKGFRFITFRGYNARGGSINEVARNHKAEKLAEALKNDIGAKWVSVNEFSLEVKSDDPHKNVLISFGM